MSLSTCSIVSSLIFRRTPFPPQIWGRDSLPYGPTKLEASDCRNFGGVPKYRHMLGMRDDIAGNSTFSVAQWAGLADPSRSAHFFARIIVGRKFNCYRNVALPFAIGTHLSSSTLAHAALLSWGEARQQRRKVSTGQNKTARSATVCSEFVTQSALLIVRNTHQLRQRRASASGLLNFDLGWLASRHFRHALESADLAGHANALSPVRRFRVIKL